MQFNIPPHLKGLTESEVEASREKHGFNITSDGKRNIWYLLLLDILKDPMLILLIAAAGIYLIVGDYTEAIFMFGAIIAVSAISFYQDNRSKKALEELKKLNEPYSYVIRESTMRQIPTHEIAVGDLCVIEEGKMINADGTIVHSNDFSVDESSLTGESFAVFKSQDTEDRKVYSGTLVVSGLAIFLVEKIGRETKLGQIGESVQEIHDERSPLQKQIGQFVKWMAIIGIIVFLLVWGYSYVQSGSLIDSLLVGLTLAMSILPEEIPVAFTTFMALGAWKLMQEGVIIKRSSVVETLGSTTVICADKTGTITENSMQLEALYDFSSDRIYHKEEYKNPQLGQLISYSMWSSEPVPFNPMEQTIHRVYQDTQPEDRRTDFQMIHEYPLEGTPPMMTHLFENQAGERIIAAKGAPEAIIQVSNLEENQREKLRKLIRDFAKQGYRLLGVARGEFSKEEFPDNQEEFEF